MLWMLIGAVVGVLTIKEIWTGFLAPDNIFECILTSCMSVAILFFCISIGATVAAVIGFGFPSHIFEGSHVQLTAIRDKDGASGQFFLGSGFIEGEQYYFYYKKLSDGGFQPGRIPAGIGTRVYEEDRKDAELVTWDWRVDLGAAWMIALPTNAGGHSYDLHVPRGTIRPGFTM